MSLQDLQRESETLWAKGFPEKAMTKLEDFGFIQSKAKVGGGGGEESGGQLNSRRKGRDQVQKNSMCWVSIFVSRPIHSHSLCLTRSPLALPPLQGEFHANNQTMAKLLHKAIGLGDGSKASADAYKAYMQHFVDSPVAVLRDCLEFKQARYEAGGG